MQLESNRIQILKVNSNSIKEKEDANWSKRYRNFTCDYGVEKKTFENTLIQKDMFSFLFT